MEWSNWVQPRRPCWIQVAPICYPSTATRAFALVHLFISLLGMGRPVQEPLRIRPVGLNQCPITFMPPLGLQACVTKLGNMLSSFAASKRIRNLSFCACGICISLSTLHLVFWGLLEGLEIPYYSNWSISLNTNLGNFRLCY